MKQASPAFTAQLGKGRVARESRADFPVCRFTGLSSPVSETGDWKVARPGRLESLPYIAGRRRALRLALARCGASKQHFLRGTILSNKFPPKLSERSRCDRAAHIGH